LRAHLEALAAIGEIVDLSQMLERPAAGKRPRFAITFDDDYPQHAAHALPVLRELGVPATFFLSGRALHGLGPYWWDQLAALVAADGVNAAGQRLGITGGTAQALAIVCESDAGARVRLAAIGPVDAERPLELDGIRALSAAGMAVGFHTLEHPLLPPLDDETLRAALHSGRAELSAAAGQPIMLFAYPHGKANARVAQCVRAAGYRAAWTGTPRPSRPNDDPFLLGRWEPGPLDTDAFMAAVAVRLHRSS
jgi:peptidoglycan/xylan/chitin deacetylase (PgdA/CDA1 family)